MNLLLALGKTGKPNEDRPLLPSDEAKIILQKAKASNSPVPPKTRLAALARIGLIQTKRSFVSTRHPSMFAGVCALAKSADKMKPFGNFGFINLEFRQLHAKYKPNYDDYTNPLCTARKELVDELNGLCRVFKSKAILQHLLEGRL